MFPPMRAHWRHLAKTIGLVLPSSHSSPQPKGQIDRFNHFAQLTAECLWARPRMSFPLIIASSHGGSGPHLIHASLWTHPSPQHKRHLHRFSRFCRAHGRKSLNFTMSATFPKISPSHGGSGPYLTYDSLGPSKPITQTASRSVQPFL